MIRWRVGWQWWLVALGTPLALLAVASFANVAIWGAPAPVLAEMSWSAIALVFAIRIVNPLDGPLGEEPGWRGYALPQLQARRSPLASTAILGVFVALWHLPLVVTGQLFAFGLVVTFFITFVYAWLFNHTGGSVLMTMLFHIAQGTVTYAALGFTGADAARMDWITGAAVVRARRRPRRRGPEGVADRTGFGHRRSTGGPRCALSTPTQHHGLGRRRSAVPAQLRTGYRPPRRAGSSRAARGRRDTSAGGGMTSELVMGRLSHGSAQVVRRFAAPERHLAFWIALWAAVVVGEFGALAQFVFAQEAPVEPVQVVFRLVGGSFAACGLIAWHRRPDTHSGRLMTATGFAFLVSPLLSLSDSPVARTLALLLPDLWVVFFVALLLTFTTGGRLQTTTDRILVGAVVFEIVVLAPLWAMFAEVPGNLLLIEPNEQVAGVIDTVQRSLFLAIAVSTAAVVAARWKAASAPGRRALMPSVAGAFCLLIFAALLTVDLVTPSRSELLVWIAASSLVTVPLAFLTGLLRSRLARGGLADLFRRLRTMQPVELQAALARTLGDPELVIAYPAPGTGTYVDARGHPVTLPDPGGERSVATVERDGAQVAVLVYDRTLDDDPELVEAVGGAATIALENRQLHDEAEARLAELQASRERILAAGDAERRRIERNLHDGAQQRLVTLAMQLSLIQRQIRDDPTGAEQLVTSASDELAQSLEELRELARGIHPAALDQGLEYALEALAIRAAVPTTVAYECAARLPEPVEFAAYFVASEALANVAKYAHASVATVRVGCTEDDAVVEIADDGVGGADPALGSGLRGLADRVEALGGRLRVSSPPGGGTVVIAEMPLPSR